MIDKKELKDKCKNKQTKTKHRTKQNKTKKKHFKKNTYTTYSMKSLCCLGLIKTILSFHIQSGTCQLAAFHLDQLW